MTSFSKINARELRSLRVYRRVMSIRRLLLDGGAVLFTTVDSTQSPTKPGPVGGSLGEHCKLTLLSKSTVSLLFDKAEWGAVPNLLKGNTFVVTNRAGGALDYGLLQQAVRRAPLNSLLIWRAQLYRSSKLSGLNNAVPFPAPFVSLAALYYTFLKRLLFSRLLHRR